MGRRDRIGSKAGLATTKFEVTLDRLAHAAAVKASRPHHTERQERSEKKRLKKSGYKTLWEKSQESLGLDKGDE